MSEDDDIEENPSIYQQVDRKRSKNELRKAREKAKSYENKNYSHTRSVVSYREGDAALSSPFASYRITLEPKQGSTPLFYVKTEKGKEFEVLRQLFIKHCSNYQNQITFAAFTPFLGCEYIYVEAKSIADVSVFVKDIRSVKANNIKQVNYEDMPSAMTLPRQTYDFKPGEFVEFTRNDRHNNYYKGDIAQVVEINLNKNGLFVKSIPRIDYSNLPDGNQDDDHRKKKENYIIPLNDFEESKLKDIYTVGTEDREVNGQPIEFKELNGNLYYDIFLYHDVLFSHVRPLPYVHNQKLGEKFETKVAPFEESIPGFKANMYQALGKTTSAVFRVGDVARILDSHEYGGMIVTVKAIKGSTITVAAQDADQTTFDIEATLLEKYFKQGDRVQITAGINRGKIGIVLSVNEHTFKANVQIVSLNQFEEVELANLAHTNQEEEIVVVLGNYRLDDFVTLTDGSMGVIWRIEHDTAHVLLTTRESRTATLSQIKGRARDTLVRTKTGKQIVKGSVVKVGNKRINATVLHTCPSCIFLKSDQGNSFSGIFTSEPNDIIPQQTQGRITKDYSGGFVQARPKPNLELKGKQIRITAGQYKGQIGDVKEATDTDMRVFLHKQQKIVRMFLKKGEYKVIQSTDFAKMFSSKPAETKQNEDIADSTRMQDHGDQMGFAAPAYAQTNYAQNGAASPYGYGAPPPEYQPATPGYSSYTQYGGQASPAYTGQASPTYLPQTSPTYPPQASPTYPPTASPTYPPTASPTYPTTAYPPAYGQYSPQNY